MCALACAQACIQGFETAPSGIQADLDSLGLVLDVDHPALNQVCLCMWGWSGGRSLMSVSSSTALRRFSRLSALFG